MLQVYPFDQMMRDYPEWSRERVAASGCGCLLSLPGDWFKDSDVGAPCLKLFVLDALELHAEQRLAALASEFRAIGFSSMIALKSDAIVEPPAAPNLDWLKRMAAAYRDDPSLAWAQDNKNLADAAAVSNLLDRLSERARSLSGRCITNSEFLAERDSLRTLWEDLPEADRPTFPLTRPPKAESADAVPQSRPLSEPHTRFVHGLVRLLDDWDLDRLVTWDLPESRGPSLGFSEHGRHKIDLPPGFPIHKEDRLGDYIRQNQESIAEQSGIDDVERWKTYLNYLRLHYWNSLLRDRYLKARRVKGFVGNLEYQLGSLLGLSAGTVKNTLKALRGKQRGS